MQVHVAQHDADRTALWGSLLVWIDLAVFQDACLQPALDQADHARIADAVPHEAEHPFVAETREEILQVRLQHPAMADPEISRFPHKERPYMPGSQTTPGPTGARNNAPADFAFRQVNNVGTRVANDFAAQWLAYTLPYRRFADVLADVCARIGGDVYCCSFIA